MTTPYNHSSCPEYGPMDTGHSCTAWTGIRRHLVGFAYYYEASEECSEAAGGGGSSKRAVLRWQRTDMA